VCRVAHTGVCFQVTTLEQETLEVLSLVLSMKNAFAPINRIPPEALSLVPDHWGRQAEKDIIGLTHVSHGWREIFTSHSSLWTHLDCKNTEKTRVYIERSKIQPLEISLTQSESISYCNDALLMTVPYINRLSSVTLCAPKETLSSLFNRFPFSTLFLKELKIVHSDRCIRGPVIPSTIFPDCISPLRKLSLSHVATDLPWRNLSNLTVFEFTHIQDRLYSPSVRQLLDFFESTPLLREIALIGSISEYSTVTPGQAIPLLNLERLTINTLPAHSTFLDRLSIPKSTSLRLRFSFIYDTAKIPVCLTDFSNLNTATINLCLGEPRQMRMRLNGPVGMLCIYNVQRDWRVSSLFQSLGKFNLSETQRLSVTANLLPSHSKIQCSHIFHTLRLMNNLRTLALNEVDNNPFIHALNPEENESRTVLCPELEELVIYIKTQHYLNTDHLSETVQKRAMISSKLSSITIIDLSEGYQTHKQAILALRKYVSRVEYKLEMSPPDWDAVFGDKGDDEDDLE